jgi:hypothetical protein
MVYLKGFGEYPKRPQLHEKPLATKKSIKFQDIRLYTVPEYLEDWSTWKTGVPGRLEYLEDWSTWKSCRTWRIIQDIKLYTVLENIQNPGVTLV